MKIRIKNFALLVCVTVISMVQVNELVAQRSTVTTVRNHRSTARTVANQPASRQGPAVRDHRASSAKTSGYNTGLSNNQVIFFDEADALFGKRTAVSDRSTSVKFTGNVKTIQISKKLVPGDNLVYKMPSGNALHVYVKNGAIQKWNLRESNRKITYPTGQTSGFSARKTQQCLYCRIVCGPPIYDDLGHHTGNQDCQSVCSPVKCSDKRKNAVLEGGKVK